MEKLVDRMVDMRRKVSPRTSYATSGSSATEIFIFSRHPSSSYDAMSSMLVSTSEFEKVTVIDDAARVDGHVLIIPPPPPRALAADQSNEVSALVNMIMDIFRGNKLKLCFFYAETADLINLLEAELHKRAQLTQSLTISRHQCDHIFLIEVYVDILANATSNASLSSSRAMERGFNGQLSVQSRNQFEYLWKLPSSFPSTNTHDLHSINDSKIRVIQRLLSKDVFDKRTSSKLTAMDWDRIIGEMIAAGKDDWDIYSRIRQYTVGCSLEESLRISMQPAAAGAQGGESSKSSADGEDGRASFLVKLVLDCIPKQLQSSRRIRRILDYGCAEGAITALLGSSLQLAASEIYGADIRAIPSPGFTFLHLKSEEEYVQQQNFHMFPQLADASIDLINASMVFHHVTNIRHVLAELRRIISPNGCLVLREHLCDSSEFAAFLDITHGLYSLAWSQPVEWPLFVSEYKAFYRNRDQWTEVLKAAGFKLLDPSHCSPSAYGLCYHVDTTRIKKEDQTIKNVIKAYYATYVPDPAYVPPVIPIPSQAIADRKRSYEDMAGQGKELWESKKYPGTFYYMDDKNTARWVTIQDKVCIDSQSGERWSIKKINNKQS
jgi:ubiquinone/menaquinone biosynthesis C-methylase UbiE